MYLCALKTAWCFIIITICQIEYMVLIIADKVYPGIDRKDNTTK